MLTFCAAFSTFPFSLAGTHLDVPLFLFGLLVFARFFVSSFVFFREERRRDPP
jgi:hypothetical protein